MVAIGRKEGAMLRRRTLRVVGRWSLLPIALFAVVLQTGETTVAARAGRFPAFIPMPGVSTRGVAVDKVGNVYVSVGQGTGTSEHILIWKFTPAGEPSFVADIGQGTIGGLMVTANGDLYVALAAGLDRGVWRMDRDGQIELLPGSNRDLLRERPRLRRCRAPCMSPNPCRWAHRVSDREASGASRGAARRSCACEMRSSREPACWRQPVPIGANGIAYYHGNLYVTNTEKGTVVRIPVRPDGSVGTPELWTTLGKCRNRRWQELRSRWLVTASSSTCTATSTWPC